MQIANPDSTFILICDWHGRLIWSSSPEAPIEIGDFAWQIFAPRDVCQAKEAVARAVTLEDPQVVELLAQDEQYLRVWLWPLGRCETALCMLCKRIPSEIAELTSRERDCLRLLAQGFSTKLIADELDIGLSTVHTHLKRMRAKLKLPRVESLISFGARFFHPESSPPTIDPASLGN